MSAIRPILLFGYGNPSRGDDALGPLLLETLRQQALPANVELLTDFQLQVEHALDLHPRKLVLFVDAAVDCQADFRFSRLMPEPDRSYSSHALSPSALLHAYQTVLRQPPPPCFLLGIRAAAFELGAELSPAARHSLAAACHFAEQLLAQPELACWENAQTPKSM